MPSDPFQNPTGVIPRTKTTYAAGAVAGNITIAGIRTEDRLLSIQSVHVGTAAVADLTSEFTITADNTINNTGGTTSAGAFLSVQWLDRDFGEETNADWNV